ARAGQRLVGHRPDVERALPSRHRSLACRLPARRRLPPAHAVRRRLLVGAHPRLAVPAAFRQRVSPRPRPVDLRRRHRLAAARAAWGTSALRLTLEPTAPPAKLPTGQQMIAAFMEASAAPAATGARPALPAPAPARVPTAQVAEPAGAGAIAAREPAGVDFT